jgi:hypothetical protein
MKCDPARGKFASDYAWTAGGTWAFLETGHTARAAPATTMVFYHGYLYLATAGGVARFPEPASAESVWPGGPHDFIDSVYALAQGSGQQIPLTSVVQLYHDPAADLLYARTQDGRPFVFDQKSNTWAVCSAADPFDKANVVVNNDLLRWTVSRGVWRLDVLPLLADMPDQSTYPLFAEGKFAFDRVRAFALVDGHYWLATDGGVCRYDSETFAPRRFYARDFFNENRLEPVWEVAANPANGPQLFCRTRSGGAATPFVFENDRWVKSDAAALLDQAYTRDKNNLMKFVQYPEGVLEAHLAGPSAAVLGTGRDPRHTPLFSRNRFSFDDVRTAVLDKGMLWSATPAGVVEYELDWDSQTAQCRQIYGGLSSGASMDRLERIVRLPGNELLAWGDAGVYRAAINASGVGLQWQSWVTLNGASLRDQMRLPDGNVVWILARNPQQDDTLTLYRLRDDMTELTGNNPAWTIDRDFRSPDASLALMDDDWIYQPVARGGLMRIQKSNFR